MPTSPGLALPSGMAVSRCPPSFRKLIFLYTPDLIYFSIDVYKIQYIIHLEFEENLKLLEEKPLFYW